MQRKAHDGRLQTKGDHERFGSDYIKSPVKRRNKYKKQVTIRLLMNSPATSGDGCIIILLPVYVFVDNLVFVHLNENRTSD